MGLFTATFESVAVLLVIGLVGFHLISKRLLPGTVLSFLYPLGLEIALPCLIFVNIVTRFDPDTTSNWWVLPFWWLGFTVVTAALTGLTMFVSAGKTRREFALSLFYQNAIFFPMPIIIQMYGQDSPYLVDLFLFTLLFPGFLFNTYGFFYSKRPDKFNWRKSFHPVFWATVLAVSIRLLGLHSHIPRFVFSALGMVGQMTVPLLMLILGGTIYLDLRQKERFEIIEVAKFVLVKNIIFPLIGLALLIIFRPSYNIALIIFLQSAVPPITSAPLLVHRESGNRAIACQFLVGSFLFALVSMPLMAMIFGYYFSP